MNGVVVIVIIITLCPIHALYVGSKERLRTTANYLWQPQPRNSL